MGATVAWATSQGESGTQWGCPWVSGRRPDPKPLPRRSSPRGRFNAGLWAMVSGNPRVQGRSRPAASAPPGDAPGRRFRGPGGSSGGGPPAPPSPGGSSAGSSSGDTFEIFSFLVSSSHRGAGVKKPRPFRGRYLLTPHPGAQFLPGGLWVGAWTVCFHFPLPGREEEIRERPPGGVGGRRGPQSFFPAVTVECLPWYGCSVPSAGNLILQCWWFWAPAHARASD